MASDNINRGNDLRSDAPTGAMNIVVVDAGLVRYGLIVDSLAIPQRAPTPLQDLEDTGSWQAFRLGQIRRILAISRGPRAALDER